MVDLPIRRAPSTIKAFLPFDSLFQESNLLYIVRLKNTDITSKLMIAWNAIIRKLKQIAKSDNTHV